MKTAKAISKQLFGAKYESVMKSLFSAGILFFAINVAEFRLEIAPFILYLTSTCFTAGVMWQMLNGRWHMEVLQGLFMLPFENRSLVFSYVSMLGAHVLITKTLLIWALFFAAAKWTVLEVLVALLCGCAGCTIVSSACQMIRKQHFALPILWAAGILSVIVLIRHTLTVAAVMLISLAVTALYLSYADAYDFYTASPATNSVRHSRKNGNMFSYLFRYLMSNKTYLINTAGLCVIAGFLPLLFGSFEGLNMFPIGLAILSMNTPICTLLSCDPDLDQAIRVLPGQAGRFCQRYCLFIFGVNGLVACIYLCSWHLMNGGTILYYIGLILLFSLQSAILSVILEWERPIRNWKTESDLWHNPRKYIGPLIMLILASFISTWTPTIWIWSALLLIECCVLLYFTRRD